MTTKTQVTQIPVGAVIDFDAHTGYTAHYEDSLTLPYEGWEKVVGQQKVAKVERVSVHPTGGMYRKVATAIQITFENGRTIHARGTSKFPVVTTKGN